MKHNLESKASDGSVVRELLTRFELSPGELARYLGTSLASVVRWERGDTNPNAHMRVKLDEILSRLQRGEILDVRKTESTHVFASRGARRSINRLPLFRQDRVIELETSPKPPILTRLRSGTVWGDGATALAAVLSDRVNPSPTIRKPFAEGVSAGKNTYTYDAHTYHTKVPPQGIAEIIKRYLPEGGVILDPFAGSGMTGVAARTLGADVILNELSPAATFIADRFTRRCDPNTLAAAVQIICDALSDLRRELYTTRCRECGKNTEILFTVWSYRVRCSTCDHDFLLWDHCRRYGKTVREHKILRQFPCPSCGTILKKSRLQRTVAEPVLLGYKCCSRRQVEHPLAHEDRAQIRRIENTPPLAADFMPTTKLPDGVNLSQPKRHGLMSIDRFYTPRNLSAMSHLWCQIHHVKDDEIAGFLAFVFTSLYQRVTKLSEFRFWGGSGNTANFNVPYIFNEANVFVTFERKSRTIQDHLGTTAQHYSGRCVVHTGSATDLSFLPDNSVDLVVTDPPFGANINYSEMNILWESWLDAFTNTRDEAIVNRFQNKNVERYGQLMAASLRECHRVLRPGHWMVLLFMNSSQKVWQSIHQAVIDSGFSIEWIEVFDKQHGTFKQFVSDNTAGCDLMLHCLRTEMPQPFVPTSTISPTEPVVKSFLDARTAGVPTISYLHVQRDEEIDYRMLYSEFLADRLVAGKVAINFSSFRAAATSILKRTRK